MPLRWVRRAEPTELAAVMALFEARVDWLRAIHTSDQWGSVGAWHDRMLANIENGATYVLCEGSHVGALVGTVTVGIHGDSDFWEDDKPALYLAKLATHPARARQGLGTVLLDWAVDFAWRGGLDEVRLDAWKTSAGLHRYYRARGWVSRGVVHDPHRMSGALFARRSVPIDLGGRLHPVEDRHGVPSRVIMASDDAMETAAIPVIT